MKGDQMGIRPAYPTPRELPLSNRTRLNNAASEPHYCQAYCQAFSLPPFGDTACRRAVRSLRMHSGSSRPDREHVGGGGSDGLQGWPTAATSGPVSHGARHEAAVWTMPHPSVEAGLAGAAARDL